VSDDNRYSEAAFKTLEYRRKYSDRFGSLRDGRAFFGEFYPWYNFEYRHSGITMLTPATDHEGPADAVLDARHATMRAAFAANPRVLFSPWRVKEKQ